MVLDLDTYLLKKKLQFQSESKKLRWIKSLKPEILVRVGTTTLIDEKEMDQLYLRYIDKQVKLRKERQQRAKRLAVSKRQEKTP
jgi:hypothetical protein